MRVYFLTKGNYACVYIYLGEINLGYLGWYLDIVTPYKIFLPHICINYKAYGLINQVSKFK